MRFFSAVLLTALLGFGLELLLPWFSVAIAALLVALFVPTKSAGASFLAGFLGIFLCWLAAGLWRDVPNDHLLSGRLAQIFFLPEGYLYLMAASSVGGLVGGLAAWSGVLLRPALQGLREA